MRLAGLIVGPLDRFIGLRKFCEGVIHGLTHSSYVDQVASLFNLDMHNYVTLTCVGSLGGRARR